MSQITDQQTEDAQSGAPTTLWDPALSWASQRAPGDTVDNQGCPPGYATIYGTNGKFCRLVSTATAAQIQTDTAPGWVDQTTINVAAASAAVVAGAATVGQSVNDLIDWALGKSTKTINDVLTPLYPWLAGIAVVYLWGTGAFESGRRVVSHYEKRLTRR